MKRAFDIAFAVVGFFFCTPVILALMAMQKLFSPGDLFYSQLRVGVNGRLFRLYKFRSMVPNADKLGTSVTASCDPRITTYGRFLRKTKLDELPQLWNVLIGDMSFVGPRPDTPEVIATYTPEMRRILSVRPGVTSIASLHLRNEEDLLSGVDNPDDFYLHVVVPAKVALAMQHANRMSFWFDFKVLMQTIWVLTLGRVFSTTEHHIVTQIRS